MGGGERGRTATPGVNLQMNINRKDLGLVVAFVVSCMLACAGRSGGGGWGVGGVIATPQGVLECDTRASYTFIS